MSNLPLNQKVTLSLVTKNDAGTAVTADSAPVWTNSNDGVASSVVSGDGLTNVMTPHSRGTTTVGVKVMINGAPLTASTDFVVTGHEDSTQPRTRNIGLDGKPAHDNTVRDAAHDGRNDRVDADGRPLANPYSTGPTSGDRSVRIDGTHPHTTGTGSSVQIVGALSPKP